MESISEQLPPLDKQGPKTVIASDRERRSTLNYQILNKYLL